MAQKRMFDKIITNSDDFLEMPASSQVLYFHLSMNADDDGFVNNWKSILKITGAKEDDLKILVFKSYIIPFESGIIVIKHWRVNNYLRRDRYTETTHKDEMAMLSLNDKGEYILLNNGIPVGIPSGNPDKIRLDKIRLDNNIYSKKQKEFVPPSLEEVIEYCKSRNNNVDPKLFYDYFTTGNWVDSKGNKVRNWKQKIITWEKQGNKSITKSDVPTWFNNQPKEEEIEYTKEEQELYDRLRGNNNK